MLIRLIPHADDQVRTVALAYRLEERQGVPVFKGAMKVSNRQDSSQGQAPYQLW